MSSSEEVHVNNDQDGELNNNEVVINCPYCDINPKGLIWLECHLAGTGGEEILPCSKVPTRIRDSLRADLPGNTREDMKNVNGKSHHADKIETELNGSRNAKRLKREESSEDDDLSRLDNSQENITTITENDLREVKMSIGRFFYANGIDSSVVNSPSFRSMISLNPGLENHIPTLQELNEWVFNDNLKEMEDYVNEVKNSWAETGCSVLLDGWADKTGRSLINVLVDSPRGTVYLCSYDISDFVENMDGMLSLAEQIVTEVGLRNVVQIVTNSTSDFMKELGKRLMAKYRSVFWTVSVSSCIDLMLEKMGDLDLFKKTLENAKMVTRFIHSRPEVLKLLRDLTNGQDLVKPSKRSFLPFLTLENIVSEEESLKAIFQSDSNLSSSSEGKRVADLVCGRSFWSAAVIVVKATIPLVRVMDWMDKNKSHMGYIYETLDQAKEAIRDGIEQAKDKIEDGKNKKYGYKKFWPVVDDVWNNHFHSHLHSGGYFLNPEIYYSSNVHLDSEICLGMACCMVRSTIFPKVQDLMMMQLEFYRNSMGRFSEGCGIGERKDVPPACWWTRYGGEHPELQQLAVRILSQTCDGASKFQLQRSLAETLLMKGRNPGEQQKLIERVFFQYNMELKGFVPGTVYCASADEIDLMGDWILNKSQISPSETAEMNGV